jgi:endo-1,3(4)-beta-glucanase
MKKVNLSSYGSIHTDLELTDEATIKSENSSKKRHEKPIFILFLITFISFVSFNHGRIKGFNNDSIVAEEVAMLVKGTGGEEMFSIDAKEQKQLLIDHNIMPLPFSTLHPVKDLQVLPYDNRPFFSNPGDVYDGLKGGQKNTGHPLSTNKWYQDLLNLPDGLTPTDEQRVYTVPYLINTVGPIPGIKLHATRIVPSDTIVQVSLVDSFGITLGAAKSITSTSSIKDLQGLDRGGVQRRYCLDVEEGEHAEGGTGSTLGPLTPLGLTLKWNKDEDAPETDSFMKMSSSIVRGMVYGTMHYHYNGGDKGISNSDMLPTVVSQIGVISNPLTDTGEEIQCTNGNIEGKEVFVQKSVEVSFWESDHTWLVFYSQPVYVRCYQLFDKENPAFVLQVTRVDENTTSPKIITSRIALMNSCTRGTSPSHCIMAQPKDQSAFSALLKQNANIYPGKHSKIHYTFFSDDIDGGEYAYLQFDWDARKMRDTETKNDDNEGELLMYSLPHHREILHSQKSSQNMYVFDGKQHCTPSLNGQSCVVKGSQWLLKEQLDSKPSFFAPRPPIASFIPNIVQALHTDISFRLPKYYQRGAGDTYFSGKMLAKLSRILLIYKEIESVCSDSSNLGKDYVEACQTIKLPSIKKFNEALDHLRSCTQVWIDGSAETPFVYDSTYGGLVSCGCLFNGDTQSCNNVYPDCPSFGDPGLNFGNAFYNDHHFHYGYHVYAAATVAYFDSTWGEKNHKNVLLLIRDFANPSAEDKYFPTYRMKDFYLGNSWASGIARSYLNGRNQESSSESIAAYEAVALYGSVMAKVFSGIDPENAKVSRHIREVGRLLTSTELRSADRYWHVRQEGPKSGIYPPQYKPHVVGIMWSMMAQLQTWFGAAQHLAIGIQLLPLTPVSELRDALDWSYQMYPDFSKACAYEDCDSQGWGILENAILATVGHPLKAIEYVEALPSKTFDSAGGNGHSLTNSIWYYSTRPQVVPFKFPLVRTPSPTPINAKRAPHSVGKLDCGCPTTCTEEVLDYTAEGFTCGDRINWLIKVERMSERDACAKVGGGEFIDICSGCDPNRCVPPRVSPVKISKVCPPCTLAECTDNGVNRCPVIDAPFLCTDGVNEGGCSVNEWVLNTSGGSNCNKCCELTFDCSLHE